MELNDVIKELEELKARVSELENRITNSTDVSDLYWAKWIATEETGEIWAYSYKPKKLEITWDAIDYHSYDLITPEQAIALCGRVPKWEDDKPTPVKR